jgi:murein DD-endopeptidase MepM/ murein hydrolase activator NlpD
LRGRGNFGVLIRRGSAAFVGSYHLGEDIWLPGGTPVRSIGDGVVKYSDFSPTWTDSGGRIHWNLGNVVVIEHTLDPAEDGLKHVCSLYVHLGADRRVKPGDRVRGAQRIGTIGRDRSDENGRYPAHLHFGIHKGPYVQVSPAWKRRLMARARRFGLPVGEGGRICRGDLEIVRRSGTKVIVRFKRSGKKFGLSLLMGSTSPGHKPADIMGWCHGYGDKACLHEWLRPSAWLAKHAAPR